MKNFFDLLSTHWETFIAILSLFVSIISGLVAIWANLISRRANQISRSTLKQAEEKASAELLKDYANSFFEIKSELRPRLQELSRVCQTAERKVLRSLDTYTPKEARPLRHVVSGLCYDLSDNKWWPKILVEDQNQYHGIFRTLWEYELDYQEDDCVKTLNEALSEINKTRLAEQLYSIMQPFWSALDDLKPDLRKAILSIGAAISKSQFEGYPISKNKKLEEEMQKSRKIFYMVLRFDLNELEIFESATDGGYVVSAFIYSVTVFRLIQRLIGVEEFTIKLDADIEQEHRYFDNRIERHQDF